MNTKIKLMLIAVAMAVIAQMGASASAATMSASPTAPVVDSKDVANYIDTGNTDKWFCIDGEAASKVMGQTFTTGGTQVNLKAITYQVADNQKAEPTKTYTIRVGTVSGSTFTEIYSETATQNFTWNYGEYMTWTLDTPLLLEANTVYAMDVGMNSSTSGWQTGIPYLQYSNVSQYAGGTRYISGTGSPPGVGDTTMQSMTGDRVFHIDMEDPMAPSPEDGETVTGGSVQLSWTNLPPNTGSDVWVDVWFGTDPVTDFSKVVDAGLNTTSTTVSAPVADTYYWRVDSYLDGAPTGDPVEGNVWTFIVDDTDGDGLPDSFELAYTSPPSNTSMNPGDDEEPDGLTNLEEYNLGTNPIVADTDGDTLIDGDEIVGAGSRPPTDPTDADTDNDTLDDGVETNTGTFVSSSDTGTNPTDIDYDADGLSDGVETGTGTYAGETDTGTNPTVPDSDGDATGDWYEVVATYTDPTDSGDNPGIVYPLPDPDGSTGNSNPVKVYIMSGQSNMVGFGRIGGTEPGTLNTITNVENKFPNLVDDVGAWTVRNDVKYRGVISAIGDDYLAPGFGASSSEIGPEFGFGHVMGYYHDEPVLLIKSSIGNRSISWDYAPPSTVQFEWNDGSTDWTYAGYGDSPNRWETGTTPVPINWYAGKQYDDCFMDEADWSPTSAAMGFPAVFNVVDILDNFATEYPEYASQGFEIAGFVWWQGHKDQSDPHSSRYEFNMVNFIKDIRAYYENRYPANTEPNAPFVLATVAFDGGWDNTSTHFLNIANGQLAVSGETGNYPEFQGNVRTMEARGYWRDSSESPTGTGYHYNHNAETYMLVGDALGRGMISLLAGGPPADNDPPTPNPATFAVPPAADGSTAISMTATTGNDASDPVQYLFTETSGNPGGSDSGWQTSPSYTDTGLDPDTQYTYTVTMRDSALTPNVGAASAPASATTEPFDPDPPTPDPATFAVAPAAVGSSSITMTATVGSDVSGPVEYFFTETSGTPGGTNSGWQLSNSYTDNGLAPNTQYTYTVTMRDSLGNVGAASTAESATTGSEAAASPDATTLAGVLIALRDHITGVAPLNASEIEAHKATIDTLAGFIGSHSSVIAASFDLVETYDTTPGFGPLWINTGNFNRDTAPDDIHWTMYWVMQYIMDYTYTGANVLTYDYLFEGFEFETSDYFPGYAPAPLDPDLIHTATIDGTYLDMWGHEIMHEDRPAVKPTGTYVAPGATAMIMVPSSIVGNGYTVKVGAHSWDHSNRPTCKRLDRVSLVYSIDSTVLEVASPLGGGIYIEVPEGQNAGIVDVQIKNAIRSPYFSAKSFHTTTLSEWQNTERNHPGPWADFQSEKFIMQVPTDWIYNFDDPCTMMQDWDTAMDALNELMGYPSRTRETMYPQVDVQNRSSVLAPGYPSCNASYSPTTSYGGNHNHYLLNGPRVTTAPGFLFHEEGHGYLFQKFPGETESNVNLLHVPVYHDKFGTTLDYAFASSRDMQGNPNRTLDNTAIAWMCSFNFSPRNVPMASGEKAYQLKGHAKFVDIAKLFGWQVLGDYWYSFNEDYENSVSIDTSIDGLILRLAKAVGVDIRPLLHFWGTHPEDPVALEAAIAAEGLQPSNAILDTLVHYKSILPADNAAFQTWAMNWWGHQPDPLGAWTESEHGRQWDSSEWYVQNGDTEQRPNGEIYVAATAADIQGDIDNIIALYFPSVDTDPPTPDPATFAAAPSADSETAVSMTATTGTDDNGPVEYYFDETSGNPGGDDSGWQTSPTYTDTGLSPSTQYTYTVQMRDSLANTGTASAPANATTDADLTAPTPDPMTWAVLPAPGSGSASLAGALGILDLAANGGINPATGAPWAEGDTYRFAFFTSATTNAVSADISTYNAWVQGLANASTAYNIGASDGATWKVIGSTPTVDARDNTATNTGVNGTGEAIFLLDGSTVVANDYADLWDGEIQNIIDLTEQGITYTWWPWTGTNLSGTANRPLGNGGDVAQGRSDITTEWIWRVNTWDPPTTQHNMYALSDPLVIIAPSDPNTSIGMTATTATDISGVEYYFDEISGNPGGTDSGWQSSPVYLDTGLTPGTQYTYTVTARDLSAAQNVGTPSTAESAITAGGSPDTDPPTPNPATFASPPAADSDTAISMTATTGSDATGPVEYFFDETSGNPGGTDSGWQTSPTYTDTGLNASTQYTYTVTMRDSVTPTPNMGTPSSPANATTQAPPDTDPPTPNPATWAIAPAADSDTAISMTATTGSDATGPVEYYFDETSGNPGGSDSGWQTSPSYTDTGLSASTQYTYTVTMRDSVTPTPNMGTPSSPANATTMAP
ncbi:MAG: M60 family metallopeptidase, partial [Planctomycetota bacterium]